MNTRRTPFAAASARPTGPTSPTGHAAPEAWWRVGMVWLVIFGPLAVVVAGIATAVIAVRGADQVLTEGASRPVAGQVDGATPAHQARNHAATAR